MPVYILTSHRTFSAAESLAYTLQQLKNAVVVGDISRGGAHATTSFSIGNGFVAFIPFSRGENVKTKTDWEGKGVIPDVAAEERNSQLIAQKIILQTQLSKAADENEKRKINWLIYFYQSKETILAIPAKLLEKYAGKFEEFVFYTQDGNLFCNTITQKNKIDKLIPVSTTLFQVDNESQVEFILDDKGNCNSIKLYWSDGWVDTISKSGN